MREGRVCSRLCLGLRALEMPGAIGRDSGSLCRLTRSLGGELLLPRRAAFPGQPVPLGMLFRQIGAVV